VIRHSIFNNKNAKILNMRKNNNFIWRGLMLDTSRHMPSIEYLYKTVDRISELGLNILHLHLSDDQGFRVEIVKYPKLNKISSFRRETVVGRNFPSKWTDYANYLGDNKPYGGFYSQIELRGLVEYAKTKNIKIVPEIDIPGHMTAILAAYPEYSAGKPPIEVATYWGKFDNVINNSNESITFLQEFFDEIIDIFEPEYIHIGGDEISTINYNDKEDPLEIIKKIIKYLNDKKVKVITWEESAESVIGTETLVMNWKEIINGYELLKKGANVIFCPREYFYLDKNQKESPNEPLSIGGLITIDKITSFKLDKNILEKYNDKIIGIQANLWTEYLSDELSMDYMIYPRLGYFAKLAIK